MLKLTKPSNTPWLLILILFIASILRFFRLSFQSPWLDEIHTLLESDPAEKWAHLFFFLKCCDQHPFLFFTVERLFFQAFGHNELIARLPAALAGIAGVWAMFLLGKELFSKQVGLIAAALTSINFFHISYSQEARPYVFSFLFCTLSFVYLARLIQSPGRKNSLLYALMVLLMLYSHYFGIFVLVAQACIGSFFWLTEKEHKAKLFRFLMLSAIITLIGYAPWTPFLMATAKIKSFWIQPIEPGFAVDFFYQYFGTENLLKPLLLLLLLAFVVKTFRSPQTSWLQTRQQPFTFSVVFCGIWIFITLFIPYLRSLLAVPMLHPRYTIVVLPAFILLLAAGADSIPGKAIKFGVLGLFSLLSFTDLLFIKHYYTTPSKTQFRELSTYIASDTSMHYPILTEEPTAWHHQYYIKKMHYPAPLITGNKNALIDSVVAKSSARFDLNGFWLIGVHGEKRPAQEVLARLDSAYLLVKQKDFFDAWASLYISKSAPSGLLQMLGHEAFAPGTGFLLDNEKVIPIWENQVQSNPIQLNKGKYQVTFITKGNPAYGVYPLISVYFNSKKVGAFTAGDAFEQSIPFTFIQPQDGELVLKLIMENDALDAASHEDRNAFIRSILIMKLPE